MGLGLGGGDQGTCYGNSCAQLTGPGGEAVSDSFYFVHQALMGNGSLTVRVTSLASAVGVPHGGTRRAAVPWAKAGIILKASLTPGVPRTRRSWSPAATAMRMQDDFTGDIAGPAMQAGWLRLTRSGATVTGYASADGARWTRVGAVALPGLPAIVQGGLFTTSPQWTQTSLGVATITGSPSQSTAVFDHAALTWRGGTWTGTDVGGSSGPAAGPATGYSRAGGQFTVMGSGDIGPVTYGPSGIGTTPAQTLAGAFIALIILAVVGAMVITAEYRSGLIRVTLAACPRRGRVLAAKAAGDRAGSVRSSAGRDGGRGAGRAAGTAVPRRVPAADDGADRTADDRRDRGGARTSAPCSRSRSAPSRGAAPPRSPLSSR